MTANLPKPGCSGSVLSDSHYCGRFDTASDEARYRLLSGLARNYYCNSASERGVISFRMRTNLDNMGGLSPMRACGSGKHVADATAK